MNTKFEKNREFGRIGANYIHIEVVRGAGVYSYKPWCGEGDEIKLYLGKGDQFAMFGLKNKGMGIRNVREYCEEELQLGSRYRVTSEELAGYEAGLQHVLEVAVENLDKLREERDAIRVGVDLRLEWRVDSELREDVRSGKATYEDAFRVFAKNFKFESKELVAIA